MIPLILCLMVCYLSIGALSTAHQYRTIPNLSRVTKVIEQNVVATHPTSFTIFKDSSDNLTGLAYEYRFLLVRDKFSVVDENAYASAQVLYVIREEGLQDPLTLPHWEVTQFGPKNIERIATLDFTDPHKHVEVFRLTR